MPAPVKNAEAVRKQPEKEVEDSKFCVKFFKNTSLLTGVLTHNNIFNSGRRSDRTNVPLIFSLGHLGRKANHFIKGAEIS